MNVDIYVKNNKIITMGTFQQFIVTRFIERRVRDRFAPKQVSRDSRRCKIALVEWEMIDECK